MTRATAAGARNCSAPALPQVTRVDRSAADLYAPPGYAVFDANAWYAFTPNLRLNLSFGNLTDRTYWKWSQRARRAGHRQRPAVL